MIRILVILALVMTNLGADTTAATRTYCNLPDAIYNDGTSTVAWGASGWNYGNAANWKNYVVTCGASHQSPIDIITTGTVAAETVTPSINYINKSTTQKYEENTSVPYTREYEGEFDYINAVDSDGKTTVKYYAKQFHMHTPSEHHIDGKSFDLELHFVHQAAEESNQTCNNIKNKLSVFAILFSVSDDAEAFEVFTPWFDNAINEVESFDLSVFFSKMTDKAYYHYFGSLTTMPCSQIVNWYVFSNSLPISKTQLAQFKAQFTDNSLFPGQTNNRPIQNLNGRVITKGTGSIQGISSLNQNLGQANHSQLLQFILLIGLMIISQI